MNNNLKVLKLFVEKKDQSFSIKKVANILKINYRIAYEETMKLKETELIKITRHGNANICQFNYKFNNKIVEIEEIRKSNLFKNKDIKLIHDRLKEAQSPFYCLVLFGSYANKTNKKGSDIDLCLITENTEVSKHVHSILAITPLNVHLQEFASKQFLAMIKSKEANVGNEIVKNNVIFYGIEAFYWLVNNVKQ